MKRKELKKLISRGIVVALTISMISGTVTPVYAGEKLQGFEVSNEAVKRNVMYYGDWSVWGGQGNFYPQDIPADQLTHLNFAFLDFDSNGDLVFTDKDAATGNPLGQAGVTWGDINAGILPALQQLRAENPNLKIGVSVGGWSKSADFPVVSKDPVKRANLVNNLMKFIEYTNMDFVDIDWEFPGHVRQPDKVDNKNDEGNPYAGPEDTELFVTLLQDLRTALDKQGADLEKDYELSIAIHPSMEKLDLGVDIDRVFNIVDFANIMSYDMRGAWDDNAGHQTGLYTNPNDPEKGRGLSIDESVNYLLSQGAESEKIVIGSAYYTRGWEQVTNGLDANNPGLFGEAAVVTKDADQTPSRGAKNEAPLTNGDSGRMSGIWSYRNLDKLKAAYPGLKEYWDDTAKAPYLYDENSGAFFTYDNVRSINEKTDYVNENDLGGMIAWMASNDKPTTSTKRDELTKATKEGLFGQAALPEYEIVYSDVDVTFTIKPYKEAWGNIGGYEVTLKNNERLEESNDVLSAVERTAETIKLPKFYIKHTGGNLTSGDYKAGTVTNENGYTIVDLSSVYDAKNLVPGTEYTFRLRADVAPENISAIQSVELTQRMKKDGEELNKQLVYGKDSGGEATNTAPVLSGLTNKTIFVGDSFDKMAGVTAYDKEDGDITSKIKVSGNVDTNTAGNYTLVYSIIDSKGLEATKSITVIVKEKEVVDPEVNEAPVFSGVVDKTIKVGDNFDTMAGVTANDKEDGDLTSKVVVNGEVNTTVVGKYTLTYSVKDSKDATTTANRIITVEEETAPPVEPPTEDSNFGVGQGIEWPKQVNAPFADMTAWNDGDFSNNGALNLKKISQDTGVKFFNLGFIQSQGGISNGKINWSWGGYNGLSESNSDGWQYEGIKKSIRELREIGGDVAISVGGLNGSAFWQETQDVDVLYNTYKDIIQGYGLTRFDLDIEGGATDKQQNIANAKAIKKVQDETGVEIVLTLAVMPTGLTSVQLDVLEAYLSQGVDVELVNLMTMCYGPSVPDYAVGSVQAVDNTMRQLKECFKRYANIDLTDEEAYRKIGTTPSVGFEGEGHPIFDVEDTKMVIDHAIEKGIGMTSMWSINRDSKAQDNKGINVAYEHTNLMKKFGGDSTNPGQNTAPVLNGVADKTIQVGDNFDALAGITAIDKEDGNLTTAIQVSGTVDTNKAGKYTLTYSVTDSKGLTTTKTRVITVEDKVTPPETNEAPVFTGVDNKTIKVGQIFDALAGVNATDKEDGNLTNNIVVTGTVDTTKAGKYELTYSVTDSKGLTTTVKRTITVESVVVDGDTFDPNTIYYGGEIVVYKGEEYKAKWWTQGGTPDNNQAWEKIVKPNEDGSVNWYQGMVCVGGDTVQYDGNTYKAKWWTNTTPGSDSSWELVK